MGEGAKRTVASLGFDTPSFWHRLGGVYDREAASVMALVLARKFPRAPKPLALDLKALRREWMKPGVYPTVPPALLRAAILSLEKQWERADVVALKKMSDHLGKRTPKEVRVEELNREIPLLYRAKEKLHGREDLLAERKLRRMRRERVKLQNELCGRPGFEVRKEVDQVLGKIGKALEK